ncbi:hypothetical protein [Microbacterium sp. 77mftsu3.1]|uniref:hypothetical protein n=1 Tax=Microbacterium sp. 77mftsu3.1 TaxID=1761802 RepID=UPI00036F173C|nr:hypothetical protein [Microbacterium sp. 77mftsu3.1]
MDMELSFLSPALRAYWTEPSPSDKYASAIEAAKHALEDLVAAGSLEDLRFLYDIGYDAGTVTFDTGGGVTITCLVDAARVLIRSDRVDLSRVTRVQLVSIDKIGGAS